MSLKEASAIALAQIDNEDGALASTLRRIWSIRWDFNTTYGRNTSEGNLRFLVWWLVDGLQQHPLLARESENAFISIAAVKTIRSDGQTVSALEELYRFTQPHVAYHFGEKNLESYRCWFYTQALARSPFICSVHPPTFSALEIERATNDYRELNKLFVVNADKYKLDYQITRPFDDSIGLVGYARSELGIGEDVRTSALALKRAGEKVSVLETPTPHHHLDLDQRISDLISPKIRSSISILNLAPIDTMVFWTKVGPAFSEGRYLIGFWPWELDQWPNAWSECIDLVDEIWTISRHVSKGLIAKTTKPVYVMPLGVDVSNFPPADRAAFALPKDPFLFFFAFDANSYAARKNPEGLLKAFRLAFPVENTQVGLVLKISNYDESRHLELTALFRETPGVFVINQTLSRTGQLQLMNSCDALVSLHRAEGFGRIIAEAMLLRKPVIATAYSGNLDFCQSEWCDLVEFRMRKIERGEYHFSEGLHWAEPSIEHAAKLMHRLYQNGPDPKRLDMAQEFVQSHYSLDTCGKAYINRLREIRAQ
jgi:glycosyltransferase involved in cell wall biosynthesis